MVVHGGLQPDVDVGRDGFGALHLGEDRVALVMDLDHFGPATRQQAREVTGAVAPHGVHHDGQAGLLDGLQVDQPVDVSLVGCDRVEYDDLSGCQGIFIGFSV